MIKYIFSFAKLNRAFTVKCGILGITRSEKTSSKNSRKRVLNKLNLTLSFLMFCGWLVSSKVILKGKLISRVKKLKIKVQKIKLFWKVKSERRIVYQLTHNLLEIGLSDTKVFSHSKNKIWSGNLGRKFSWQRSYLISNSLSPKSAKKRE